MTGKALRGKTPVTYEDTKARMREYRRRQRAGLPTSDVDRKTMISKEEIMADLGIPYYQMRKLVQCPNSKMPEALPNKFGKSTWYSRKEVYDWYQFIKQTIKPTDKNAAYEPPKVTSVTETEVFFDWLKQYKPRPHSYWYEKFIERYDNGNN